MAMTKRCKNCGQQIPFGAKNCPNCGAQQSSFPIGCIIALAIAAALPIIFLAIIFFAAFISVIFGNSKSSETTSLPDSSIVIQTEPETEEITTEETTEEPTEATTEELTEATTEPETEATTEAPVETTEEVTEKSTEIKTKDDIIRFGDLLDLTETSTYVVIKAKIRPSYSNQATIRQNYFNIEKLVQDYGYDKYQEIQYWAVADMQDGSEAKVISFTVPKSTIDGLKSETIPANLLGDEGYVTDLWILPSLLESD
ncbi:MAG: zinc ribbon domain-containing protein [Oscillospiraceae bacterium]|nr:zinc ribbon domain-containing protein [Oscillospiraceae bacterium]